MNPAIAKILLGAKKGGGWDLSKAVDASKSFSVSSQESSPTAMHMAEGGLKLFLLGTSGDDINQYGLSTPYDIATASYVGVSGSINAQDASHNGLDMNADLSIAYTCGIGNDDAYQYTLSTPGTITSLAYASKNIAIGDSQPRDIKVTPDGTRAIVSGTGGESFYWYDLGTPGDLSTAGAENSYSISGLTTGVRSVAWKPDGTRAFLCSGDDEKIYQVDFSTPWLPSSMSHSGVVVDLNALFGSHTFDGIIVSDDGLNMYFLEDTTIRQFYL